MPKPLRVKKIVVMQSNRNIISSKKSMNEKEREAFYKYLEFQNKRYDTELQLFWQRSVFVSTFLVLILTGYGALLIKIVELHSIKNIPMLLSDSLFNSLASVISTMGIIVSYIWFRIARGAKGTYEAVESRIYDPKQGLIDKMKDYAKDSKLDLRSEFYKTEDVFKLDSGPYSPSKLNIIFVFFFLVLFSMLLTLHLIALFFCDLFLFLSFTTVELLLLLVFILVIRLNSVTWWQVKIR